MEIKGSGVWGSGNQDGESGNEEICGLRDEGMGLEVGNWRSGDQVIRGSWNWGSGHQDMVELFVGSSRSLGSGGCLVSQGHLGAVTHN